LSSSLNIREIQALETLPLRKDLLRPHLTPEQCIYPVDDESATCHLGGFIDDSMVSIVSIYQRNLPGEQNKRGYQFRALAVVEAFRSQGYGLALLHAVEKFARENAADYLWANARMTAVEFYRKAGYTIDDKEFIVEGVGPHVIVSRPFY